MRRLALLVLSSIVFISNAHAQEVNINSSFDKVWPAVVSVLSSEYGMELKIIDKDSGLIQTDFKDFGNLNPNPLKVGPSEFVKKIATVKTGFFEPTFDLGRYKANINIVKNPDGTTSIKPAFKIELLYSDGNSANYLPTNSTGYLESEFISKVKSAIQN